jgi:hypothetical protein
MGSVLQFPGLRHALAPNWMPHPDNWMWVRPDGVMQGFGNSWRDHVGLANLFWLALDMDQPPKLFDARQHQLYMLLLMYGSPTAGTLAQLVELAEFNPLPVFRRRLAMTPEMAMIPRHNLAPLLLMLADGRVHRENA